MKNTGALLKAKRESSNLSLSEVALATKINPKILAAIEEGNDSILPAKTILKGFLKSYALFLKMDVEEVIRTFQEETGAPPPRVVTPNLGASASVETPRGETPAPARRRVSDDSSTGMRTAAVIVIVVLIGLIIGVRELIEKYQREKVIEQVTDLKASPVDTATTPSPVPVPSAGEATPSTPAAEIPQPSAGEAKPMDKTAEAAKPEAPKPEDAKPAEKAPPIAASTPLTAPPIVNPIVVTPQAPSVIAAPVPAPVVVKPEEKKAEEKKPEEKKPEIAVKAKHEIILEALDKVEVKFQLKGETKRVSLGPTQVHTIHADQPMTIDLSDGGAVNVILDGRERGVPGDLGKPKTIKIP